MTERLGGLPDDPDLAAAFARRPQREKPRVAKAPEAPVAPLPVVAEEPAPVVEPEAPEPVLVPAQPAPVESIRPDPIALTFPDLGPTGKLTMQCAVNISLDVRDRFDTYQAAKTQETSRTPTNAVVVRRAVNAANNAGAFFEIRERALARLQPDEDDEDDSGSLFGEVEGRRSARGRIKQTAQQPFRPSRQELAVIDVIWEGYGFPSRSDFLDAVLDWWLPDIPRKKPRS
jgi:hypothetical protein